MEAKRTGGESKKCICRLERRQFPQLSADDPAVAEIEPAVELLLPPAALDKDRAGLLAQVEQLNDVGERKIAQIALKCHNRPTGRRPQASGRRLRSQLQVAEQVRIATCDMRHAKVY